MIAFLYLLGSAIGGGIITLGLASIGAVGDRLFGHLLKRNAAKFESKLEGEIEELKASLNRLGDRSSRSNEREYNAIVAAWEGYVEAYLATQNCVARLDEHSDLEGMGDNELEEWLTDVELPKQAAKMVREAGRGKRNSAYGRFLQWKAMNAALKAHWEARQIVRKQGIFIPRDLENQFLAALDQFSRMIAAVRADYGARGTDLTFNAMDEFFKDGPKVYEALKDAARNRLMYQELSKALVKS